MKLRIKETYDSKGYFIPQDNSNLIKTIEKDVRSKLSDVLYSICTDDTDFFTHVEEAYNKFDVYVSITSDSNSLDNDDYLWFKFEEHPTGIKFDVTLYRVVNGRSTMIDKADISFTGATPKILQYIQNNVEDVYC